MQDAAELPEIRAFVALADTGSFAAASRLLQRDSTVLSRRLQALEARLGVRLAERTTRRVSMTDAGRAYLARVRPLLQDLEAADREAAAFIPGEPRGRMKVALPDGFAGARLHDAMVGFLQACPQVRLDLHHAARPVDVVAEGFDAALRLGAVSDTRVTARKLADIRPLVCAAPAYLAQHPAPLQPEDIQRHDCLCLSGQDEFLRWDFRPPGGAPVSVGANCRFTADDAELLLAAAAAGLGLLRTTDWHARPLLASGQLVEVLTAWPALDPTALYLVTPGTGLPPGKTRALSDHLAQALTTQT